MDPVDTDDRTEPFEEDPRFRISAREAWISVLYWAAFTAAMVSVAWGIGGGRPAADTRYILGFPDWFFYSALVTVAVFSTVVPYLVVRYLFTDMPLGASGEGADEEVER